MPAVLVLLSKPDCHLCHEMRGVLETVLPEFQAILEERNVLETDPETRTRYLYEIPVLLLDSREVARHRVAAAEMRRRLGELGIPPRIP